MTREKIVFEIQQLCNEMDVVYPDFEQWTDKELEIIMNELLNKKNCRLLLEEDEETEDETEMTM